MMSPESNREWYADGLKFRCTQCGNCCTGPPGYVWFNDEEARSMAAELGLSEQIFRDEHAHQAFGRWTLNERWNSEVDGYDCIFLKRDAETGRALCQIYSVRPGQCRTWPFWPENLRSRSSWQKAGQNCPGMDKGDFFPVEDIRIFRDATPQI